MRLWLLFLIAIIGAGLMCLVYLQGTQIQATMFKDAADKFYDILQLDKVFSIHIENYLMRRTMAL